MIGSSVVSVVLWAAALVATVWVLVPTIAFVLRIGGVRTDVVRDVGPPPISGDQAVFDERLRQLAALDFRDVGYTRQTALFMLPAHWRWEQFETTRWLVGPDGRTHATLYRMIRDEPARISLITVFDDGGVVRTACPGIGIMPSLPNYRVTEIRGVDASELLAAHEQQVATFARDRGVNARAATVAEVATAVDAAERPLMRQTGNGMHGWVLPFAPAALFVVGGFMTGLLWSPLVPLGICVAAATYAFRRWMIIGPLRHVVTRHTHVGDALRELGPGGPAPLGPSPAGPAEIAPDGTTAAMRKGERALRAAAGASGVLASVVPIGLSTHPPAAVAAGAALIGCQLLFICVTAMAGLTVLHRARGGPNAKDEDSGSSLVVPGLAAVGVLALMGGRGTPGMYGVAGLTLAVMLVIKLLPKKNGD